MQPYCLKKPKVDFEKVIHSSLNSQGGIEKDLIKKIIPYGDDFLFLDYVDQLTQNSIVGFFDVPVDQPYIKAHFVGNPIMPGCLVAESFAQAGTILIRYNLGVSAPVDIFVGKIETAKFESIVKPGQQLRHSVALKNLNVKLGIARLEGKTFCEETQIATFGLILIIKERVE